jgi:hypothetical protein
MNIRSQYILTRPVCWVHKIILEDSLSFISKLFTLEAHLKKKSKTLLIFCLLISIFRSFIFNAIIEIWSLPLPFYYLFSVCFPLFIPLFLFSCFFVDYVYIFSEFHFDLSGVFLRVSLCMAFHSSWSSIKLYIHNLSQSTCTDKLSLWMKYGNIMCI